jgi:transposase
MPRQSPFRIILTPEELKELSHRARQYTLSYIKVQRAKAILLAAQGVENKEIAHRLDMRREIICLWRKRFYENRLRGLEDLPRPGRPRG